MLEFDHRFSTDLSPGVHDPAVIARNGSNDVHTLLMKLVCVLDVRRKVVRLAAGREGTGHGEQDDFLVCPFFAGVVFLRTATGGWVSVGNGCPSVECDVSCNV